MQNNIDTPHCIITHLLGGLGNQMFQYACARALSLQHGVPVLLDISAYATAGEGMTPRHFCLDVFPALARNNDIWREATTEHIAAFYTQSPWQHLLAKILRRKTQCKANLVTEPHLGYWQGIQSLTPPVYLRGYWQNEKYFADYRDTLISDFSFPSLPHKADALAMQIAHNANPTAVHIRRGDYAYNPTTQAVHGLCTQEYYAGAIKYIQSHVADAHLFLFSDDPAWVREHFNTHGLPATVLDLHGARDAHHDMHLMTLCKHHVIANSSFSWWGAWLKQNMGIVCAPKSWFAATQYATLTCAAENWAQFDRNGIYAP